MAFIYWIKHKDHTDIFSEGYIGYTSKTVEERWKGHHKEAKSARCPNYPVYNAMKKYKDDIVIVTLLEGPEDYCANIEQKLRPAIKIGWNIHVGGNKGFKGDTHSDEAKHKISVAGKGRKFSDEHKKKIGEANRSRVVSDATRALQSDRRKGLPRGEKAQEAHRKTLKESPWRNATANHFVWSMAGNFFEEYLGNLKLSAKGLAKVFELKETQVTTILEKFRGGWKPYEDSLWMDFKTKYEEVHSVS